MPDAIYGLIHQNEIRYVGRSRNPEGRYVAHLRARGNDYRDKWIRDVDYDVQLVILERDPPGGLAAAEKAWIACLRACGCRLTNLSDGGESGSAGCRWTDEQREAHRVRMTPVNRTVEKRAASAKGGKKLVGRTLTQATRSKISATLTGRKNGPLSAETRAKISAAKQGKPCNHGTGCGCSFCVDPGRGAQIRWARRKDGDACA